MQLLISSGTGPESRFPERSKKFKFLRLPMVLGMLPVILLFPSLNLIRDMQLPISDGIEPDISFEIRSNFVRF
jgi:hypothetical protein